MDLVVFIGSLFLATFAGVGVGCFGAAACAGSLKLNRRAYSAAGLPRYLIEAGRFVFLMSCGSLVGIVWMYLLVHLHVSPLEVLGFVGGLCASLFCLYRLNLLVSPILSEEQKSSCSPSEAIP